MRLSPLVLIAALTAFAPVSTAVADEFWLITHDEAAKPKGAARPKLALRSAGPPGPQIVVVSPKLTDELHSPLAVTVRFQPRGDSAVDPASLKVVVQKMIDIDITDRVRPYASAEGIAMDQAKIPAGEHSVEISVADDKGRRSTEILKLTVTKP